MKKLFVLFVGIFLALGLFAQRNSFYFGDKNAEEIKTSIEAFNQLVVDYEASVLSLKGENEKMMVDFQKGGAEFAKTYAKKTEINDSLIALYNSKIFEIKETKQSFLEMTAGKTNRRTVKSRGNNPQKLAAAAEAYITMSYADAYLSRRATNTGKEPLSDLKGLIVNKHYQDLIVTVRGPGSWQRQFSVSRNGGQAIFNPPYPGQYVFSFSNGRSSKTAIGYCRPGLSEFYDEQGNKYDLMATMPRGY